jgi:heme/copper-type cytochrome/quinol oxidase subunit 2
MRDFFAKTFSRMLASAAAFLTLSVSAAQATTFSDLATGMNSQMGSFATLMVTASFVIGIGIVLWSIWTFRVAHKSEGRDAKLSHGVVGMMVGAALLALPAVTGISVSSLFAGGTGSAAEQGSISVGN